MPKTKVSEWSATPGNNTDIDSINISENCPPSGINDAIREMMSQIKDFQTGAAGDSFNGPVGSTTPAAGAFTTLSASGAVTLSGGTANGIPYLNGSKVLTSGSALTFDGTTFKSAGTANNEFAIDTSSTPILSMVGGASTIPLIGYKGSGLRFGSVTGTGAAGFSDQMQLTSSGNLGLGVTPSAWTTFKVLQSGQTAYASNGTTALFYGNTYFDGTERYITTGTAARFDVNNTSSQPFRWYTAPSGTAGNAITFTQAMTLDASGNLLVGFTAGSLNNSGSFQFSPGTSAYGGVVTVNHSTSNVSGSGYVNFGYNGSAIGSIAQNGTTGVLYNMVSDHRLKTVLGSITDSGTRIDALEPIEYEWKADGSRTRGFLAHKFQEVYAGSVTGTKDAVDEDGKPVYQAMQAGSSEVIADLVAEIKSLRQRVSALEAA